MNDTNFISGGRTSSDPVLLAFLNDPDGINATGLGVGHEIIALVDDNSSHPIILNDYYQCNIDNYQGGTVTYPMSGLTNGLHKLTLTAWDTYDNSAHSEISFFVFDQPELSVGHVINYPNPVSDKTTFFFTPFQNTGTLDIQIQIFSISGHAIKTIELSNITELGNAPVAIGWDGRDNNGNKPAAGLYLYKLMVSGSNGAFTQTTQKMIILN
jgi:hypothetical protein